MSAGRYYVGGTRATHPLGDDEAQGHARELRAMEALLTAFKENPLLEREHAPARQEAERLLGKPPSHSR